MFEEKKTMTPFVTFFDGFVAKEKQWQLLQPF